MKPDLAKEWTDLIRSTGKRQRQGCRDSILLDLATANIPVPVCTQDSNNVTILEWPAGVRAYLWYDRTPTFSVCDGPEKPLLDGTELNRRFLNELPPLKSN